MNISHPLIRYSSINITTEPIKNLYPEEVENFRDSFLKMKDSQPIKALKKVDELIVKYPNCPILTHWKLAASATAKLDVKILDNIIQENYQKFPDYIFAKIAYAQNCFNNNQLEKVPEIFNNKWIIDDLYPNKKTFHITEVASFYFTLTRYFCYKKETEKIDLHLDLLIQLATNYPEDNDAISKFLGLLMAEFPDETSLAIIQGMSKLLLKDEQCKPKVEPKKTKSSIPIDVQNIISAQIEAFNKKNLKNASAKYRPVFQGKFIYLMRLPRDCGCNECFEKVARLTYNGNVKNMDFAIYKYSSEKYDPNEVFFPGSHYVNGTLEGALKAGLEAYPI